MILITGFNEEQAPLGELTAPLMESYAKRHNLGFRCVRFEARGKEAYWQKIIETLRAFDEGFDRVMWLDADQMITNPDYVPGKGILGFSASRDWGSDAKTIHDFSMCGYVASVESRDAFEWVNDNHDKYIDGDFPEQTPMREFFRQNPKNFWPRPRRDMNAVPDEVSPGNVVEPWQPRDFAAHLTMLSLVDRVSLLHQIQERIK